MTPLPLVYSVTQSGRVVDMLNPRPETVSLADIAVHLARINRFGGACPAYSVAEHSCLVAAALAGHADPLAPLCGLLHDAHEAYLGDTIRPVRHLRARIAGTDLDKALTPRFGAVIHKALGLPWPVPEHLRTAIREADARALATEWRDLMPKTAPPGLPGAPEPYEGTVVPLGEQCARALFLRTAMDTAARAGLGPLTRDAEQAFLALVPHHARETADA
ncbi:phosphohydrolase [Kaustia mangrovi]|uniref:Phosphohydrolase n=1 Tax=Kaustia mangrovi TaxID=2593653 RepID=A0A7S8C7U3_9HYPH|nr:hypothetical protein [Kaustia mangrovi]QPC45038.1 phosphohydrolase [Kaustia mangrovi]